MAVEARHLNLFPPQMLSNREIMNSAELNYIYSNNAMMGYNGNLVPAMADTFRQKTPAVKSESGLSYNQLSDPPTRKRSRDSMVNPLVDYQNPTEIKNNPFSFLGQDLSFQIQQQESDIHNLVSHHMEKVRIELEERRKRQARRLIETIGEGMLKRLRAKEEEISKIGRINWALEEKVKSLYIENQIWRDLAQTNEATANALRANLEELLAAQDKDVRTPAAEYPKAEAGDAESCCGSTSGEGDEEDCDTAAVRRGLARGARAQDKGAGNCRMCRNCGREEASVLLLPCRHLCLCTVCGSSLSVCPICKATKNASFHVNLS